VARAAVGMRAAAARAGEAGLMAAATAAVARGSELKAHPREREREAASEQNEGAHVDRTATGHDEGRESTHDTSQKKMSNL
jgi:hypothetical protein